jgi:hypothetical protein
MNRPESDRTAVQCKQCDTKHYPPGSAADHCDVCRRPFSSDERGNAYCERHYLAANRPALASVLWLVESLMGRLRVLWVCSACFAKKSRRFSDPTTAISAKPGNTVRIGACGHENPPQNRFCDTCGTKLNSACPACGSPNRPESKFCGHCGESLGARTGATDRQAPRTPDEPSRDADQVPAARPPSFYKDWDSSAAARPRHEAENEIGAFGNLLISFSIVAGSLGALFLFIVLASDSSVSDGQRLVLWVLLLSCAGSVAVGCGLLRRAKIALYALYVSCGVNTALGLGELASQQGQLMVQGLLGIGFSALWFFYFHRRAHLFE